VARLQEIPSQGYEDWKAGAIEGAVYALRLAGRLRCGLVISKIIGLAGDTTAAAVGAAAANAVWAALDFRPPTAVVRRLEDDVLGVYLVFQDIEPQKHSQTTLDAQSALLRESEERFRSLFVQNPDGVVVLDRDGTASHWISVRRDITKRKITEEALRGSEERYRLLFESNPNPMMVYDLETLFYLAVNEAAIRLYGYPRQEFLSMTISDIRPPDEHGKVSQIVEHAHRSTIHVDTYKHRKKDGGTIDVEVTARSIVWKGRNARLLMVNDITERRQAELALRDSTARLSLIIDQMPAILWTTDAQLRFTSSQGAGLADLGLEPTEVTGKSIYQYFQTEDPNFAPIAAHVRALAGYPRDLRGALGSLEASRRPILDKLLAAAEKEGRLAPGATVLEPTSGRARVLGHDCERDGFQQCLD